MHLVNCRFAPAFWLKYIKGKDLKEFVKIVKGLLKEKNNSNVTPIQKHMNSKQLNPKAISKLFSEGLIDHEGKDTFEGHENEILDFDVAPEEEVFIPPPMLISRSYSCT